MTTVDWSRPIEAVSGSGRVLQAHAFRRQDDPPHVWFAVAPGEFGHPFNNDGTPVHTLPYRIRNAPAAELPGNSGVLAPELQQRMVAFVKWYASGAPDKWFNKLSPYAEAMAIVADPGFPAEVDGDEREADMLLAGRMFRLGSTGQINKEDIRGIVVEALRRGKQMAGEA